MKASNPNSSPSVEGIFRASVASGPMESLQSGNLIANVGLEGDRYSKKQGTYSCLRASSIQPGVERELGTQITLISGDSLREVISDINESVNKTNSSTKCTLEPKDLRRNIVLKGISAEDLLNCISSDGGGTANLPIGRRKLIQLGETCIILPQRNCVPCVYNAALNKDKFPEHYKSPMEVLWNKTGVNCQVLVGGVININDTVRIMDIDLNGQKDSAISLPDIINDPSSRPPSFYLPPSKRNLEMAKKTIESKRKTRKQLEVIGDHEGVKRIEASYNSVGLTFWPAER